MAGYNIDPFGKLAETQRWVAQDKQQRQQMAKRNALADIQQQSAQLGLQQGQDKQAFMEAARTGGVENALKAYPVIGQSMIQQQQRGASQRGFAPVTLYNEKTDEYKMVMPSFNPATGGASLSNLDIPQGFSVIKEDPLVARQRDVTAAQQKETAVKAAAGKQKRAGEAIESGIDASRGMASVIRGIDLLDMIQTGGVDRAALAAKQLFGVETADEAELSGLLGKAVLSQLRATFGAQFTQQEGDRLARIEAGFTKSTAGNKRLLKNALKIMERAANRGLEAAGSIEDKLSIDEITKNMEFRLGESKFKDQSPTVTNQSDYDKLPSGAIFIEDGQQYRKP